MVLLHASTSLLLASSFGGNICDQYLNTGNVHTFRQGLTNRSGIAIFIRIIIDQLINRYEMLMEHRNNRSRFCFGLDVFNTGIRHNSSRRHIDVSTAKLKFPHLPLMTRRLRRLICEKVKFEEHSVFGTLSAPNAIVCVYNII